MEICSIPISPKEAEKKNNTGGKNQKVFSNVPGPFIQTVSGNLGVKDPSFVAEVKNLIYHHLQKPSETKLCLLTLPIPTVNGHTLDVSLL